MAVITCYDFYQRQTSLCTSVVHTFASSSTCSVIMSLAVSRGLKAMDFEGSGVSSDNETSSAESDTEAKESLFLIYLNLFGLPLGVLLVVVPALTVIIIVLKNRKLRRESSKIFYVNLLITEVVSTLMRWVFTSTIVITYLLGSNMNCKVAIVPVNASIFAT